MVSATHEQASTEEVLSLLHPVVAGWFRDKFEEVTEAQSMAVPLIHRTESVLVSSPTGSGKTLTAFLSILNELTLLAEDGRLEDRIYAVYVSPLKALANDINENLLKPLEEISSRFEAEGRAAPGIRVAVRTGDTLQSERQKQARKPPHIFITTPESLALVLSTPVFAKRFDAVQYVIVDEVHEICDSKRGVSLSVSLERLQSLCARPVVRIGLSATVAPITEVAEFLAGAENGSPRPMKIAEVFGQRALDLKVLCPTDDMTALSFEVVNSKMYDLLKEMIEPRRTTLVFTNTRSGAESVVYKLKERGLEQIGTHHGSLSRETRLEVESSLREGALKAVVSSTSLELGIDIGSIDLVVQIGSPKSVAKGLQRVGRAGHQYGGTSTGRMVVFESDDLIECAVLSRAAHRKAIDRVTIPQNSLDVLAQIVVGLSLERKWGVDESLELFRRSYCYRDLTREDLVKVLKYLGGKDDFDGVYSKIWYDEVEGVFGRKRGSRMIYYLNQGTIPEEADYKVFSERGAFVGSLSEKFVERLSKGDIFVLGGRSYEFIRSKGMKALVRSASGRKPTVPSWTGEMLPRSFDLSIMVGEFREEMRERLEGQADDDIRSWLMNEFHVDAGSATTIINYFREQKLVGKIPTDNRLVVEGYIDQSGNRNAIFHFPFGRRVNDALSRAYASALSEQVGANVTVSISDDCFMLTVPRAFELEDLANSVDSSSVEQRLRDAISGSELFNQRFRHVATRSFMILRNYKGKELSVGRQQLRSQRLLDALHEIKDFPVIIETFNEILTEVMDLEHALEVLRSIESGDRTFDFIPFSAVPTPFAHNIILIGVSDIVLMEDKSLLLRNLHRRVIERVLGEDAADAYQFDPEEVEAYYASKFPRIASKDDILHALRLAGPMNLLREKGESVYAHSDIPFNRLRSWSEELVQEGAVRSVWVGEDVYVDQADHALYASVHRRRAELSSLDSRIVGVMGHEAQSASKIARKVDASVREVRERLRRMEISNFVYRSGGSATEPGYGLTQSGQVDRGAAASEIVARHLAYHAPISLEDVAYEVGLSEDEAKQVLAELMSREMVVSGRFVVGEQVQYMLSRDYIALTSEGAEIIDRDTVRSYLEHKQFEPLDTVREYFEKFGSAGMAYDLFHRVKGFSIDDFFGMRAAGEVLLGRFVKGRVRYVLSEDAPHFLGVFGTTRLSKHERAVAAAVSRLGSGTYQEVAEAAGIPPSLMRESFDSLDRKGLLLREFDEAEYWTSRNTYALCELEPETEDPYSRVLERFLRGYGPASVAQVASYLDLEESQARQLLRRIDARAVSVGLEQAEMFLMKDELEPLKSFSHAPAAERPLRILSLYDPFLSDRWAEIAARYGEGWIFPVLHGGDMVGMIESWLMAEAVDIRDIRLQDEAMLGRLVEAIDGMMPFYAMLGVDIVRVRSVLGEDVSSADEKHKAEFTSRGFVESNGMLSKGSMVHGCHGKSEILATILSMQNIRAADALDTMEDALDRYGGLRSDAEAIVRVRRFEPLSSLHKRGEVVRGYLVPDRVGYCTHSDAGLYRAARATERSEEETMILRIIGDRQPIKRNHLLTLSPLGPERTVEAIRSLYRSSQIFLDHTLSYVLPRKRRYSREGAWLAIISRLMEFYGIASAETLGYLLGRDLRMRELRALLRKLQEKGVLVKGHLLEGSSTVYWATRMAASSLGEAHVEDHFILSHDDNLHYYLRASFKDFSHTAGRHLMFSGTELVGSFSGRIKDGALLVEDYSGDEEFRWMIGEYASRIGIRLRKRDSSEIPDWEIMSFYEKSHPGID